MKRAASLCLLTVLIAGAVLAGVGSAASDPGWGAAVSLESNNLDATFPQVAVDPRGNAIAVWRQFDGNIDNLTANRYVAGLGWTGEVLIEAEDAGGATQPQIALDPPGKAIVGLGERDGRRGARAGVRRRSSKRWTSGTRNTPTSRWTQRGTRSRAGTSSTARASTCGRTDSSRVDRKGTRRN